MAKNINKKRWIGLGLFVCIGTYNAVVINTSSFGSKPNIELAALESLHPGRVVATGSTWKKLTKNEVQKTRQQVALSETTTPAIVEAAIKEELRLNLIEVSNPKKWKNGLSSTDFDGSLATADGVLESFEVSLPNDEEISIAFIEMNGNVFNYDLNGEVYSAMIFQADQNSYLVTFTNGPLEGTRLRFINEASSEQAAVHQTLSEEHNIEVGNFGVETKPAVKNASLETTTEFPLQVQVFNFDQQVL